MEDVVINTEPASNPSIEPTQTSGIDPMLQHMLETKLHQQAVTQDLAQSLRITTQELLQMKESCSTDEIPLPDPCREAQHLFTKLSSEDNVEAFLETFKRIALREEWEQHTWADILSPLLSGDAQLSYYGRPLPLNYETLTGEILVRCGLFPTDAAAEFHKWSTTPVSAHGPI